ncbi:CaiB/BaiF CoA transferase family protein [Streptomyces sp. NPDC055078]
MSTTASTGPLAGVRVIELGGIGPAPYCGMLLADQGAEVVRVDPPAHAGKRSVYPVLHRNRRSVSVDLKKPAGADAVRRLIGTADAVIEGFRPGVAERLGLGPEECMADHPRLVYGRMTGWGQNGSLARTPGHDVNYLAISGALSQIGTAGGPPVIPLNLVADMGGGGMMLAFGMVSGLLYARTTGNGQIVDAAMTDGTVSQLAGILGQLGGGKWQDGRDPGNGVAGNAPWYRVYECADGGHMAAGCLEPQFYAAMLRTLGLENDPLMAEQHDRGSWPAMVRRVAEIFATRDRAEWTAVFEDVEACVTPVLGIAEAAAHPHNAERGLYFTDRDGRLQPSPAPRLSTTPADEPRPAPVIGTHTREVLAGAGLTDDQLDELAAAGTIG